MNASRASTDARAQRRAHVSLFFLPKAVCIFFMSCVAAIATAAEYEAPAVKAAFLHRFAAYVEWPRDAMDAKAPFTIGVMNDDDMARHLQRLLPGLTIQNRSAQVRRISSVSELEGVHILYIGSAQASRAKTIVEATNGQPILVVTDHTTGLDDGAVINFVSVGRNVRFEVSLRAARRHGLQINSGLLSVAVRIEQDSRGSVNGPDPSHILAADPHAFIPPTERPRRRFLERSFDVRG